MAETLSSQVELEQAAPDTMEIAIANLERSVINAKILQDVLNESEPSKRGVRIESVSSSLDLGGFFMDERHSDMSYREEMRIGPHGGDSLLGVVKGLVIRETDSKKELQIEVDAGYVNYPIKCFFKFDSTLEGCIVSRLGEAD